MKTLGHRHPRIRLLRRRAGLSQFELAALLGHHSHSQVSRYENGRRIPTAAELLALEIIFGVVPGGVFPHLREQAAEAVVARIDKLIKRPDAPLKSPARPSRKHSHCLRILESIRQQSSPGLTAHDPWPTASSSDTDEMAER